MELIKINGNTYYIDNPTNVGLYIYKNKYCLMIDTGLNNNVASKIDQILSNNGIKPKYIVNTHNHPDHSGGNAYFREHHPGTIFYTSEDEKLFIENDYMFHSYIYGAYPNKELHKRNAKSKGSYIDNILDWGVNKINDEKFEIISLKGHSQGQIGICTPDKVCFLGDSIFSEDIISKYSFPFLFDIEEQLKTIECIGNLEYDYYILGHGSKAYSNGEMKDLAIKNKLNIEKHLTDIKELLNQPLTKEELFGEICILNNMKISYRSFHLCLSSMSAFLAYLYDKDTISYEIENGKLYYFLV
ncbi:hydroxyacylglutathione hydrolase [Oxobacter pfennigii]|uniref:Hydroxyacylglutathione hydrolase n=1 Tax=Oxobacter pfennigii TaxID=36849 RepID=A0A0P8WBG7_9CLOT|nr:MBL fold metallo-hydrolase [Oxobacter pfennigii]KPU45963.1 hydroxyacylglutathione hydrolase [Oxobacter pfennigii]